MRSTLDDVFVAPMIMIHAMIKLPEFLEDFLDITFVDVTVGVHLVQYISLGMEQVVQHH